MPKKVDGLYNYEHRKLPLAGAIRRKRKAQNVLTNQQCANIGMSVEEVGIEGKMIFAQYVLGKAEIEQVNLLQAKEILQHQLLGASDVSEIKQIAQALRLVGDELDKDDRLQRLIAKVPVNSPYDTFRAVAAEIFCDGLVNWGRVVTLFYFAYKLLLQAVSETPLIQVIIEWTYRLSKEFILPWITSEGGWKKILTYVGSTPTGLLTVFMGGMLAASTLMWLSGSN